MVQRVKTIDKRGVDKNAEQENQLQNKRRKESSLFRCGCRASIYMMRCQLSGHPHCANTHTRIQTDPIMIEINQSIAFNYILIIYIFRFSSNRSCVAPKNNSERKTVHRRHTFLIELICLFNCILFCHCRRTKWFLSFRFFTVFKLSASATAIRNHPF